eukprot:5943173-Pyramimonas_sp.AAC.1
MWAFGGASCGATKSVTGVPKWARWAHASAVIWAFGRAPFWGHGTLEGCANMGTVGARERWHLGRRWGSAWGH